MIYFILGISICFNIICGILIFMYFKFKLKKINNNNLFSNLDMKDIEKNWNDFFMSGGYND